MINWILLPFKTSSYSRITESSDILLRKPKNSHLFQMFIKVPPSQQQRNPAPKVSILNPIIFGYI